MVMFLSAEPDEEEEEKEEEEEELLYSLYTISSNDF